MVFRHTAFLFLAAGPLLAGCTSGPVPTRGSEETFSVEYSNPAYGYAFELADTFDVRVYSPEHMAVGRDTEDGFSAVLEAGVFVAEEGSPAAFEDFMADRARTVCAADGPGTSLRCTEIEQRMPFETETGLTGEVFHLKHEAVDEPTGTVSAVSGRGPFFVFNLSANVPTARHAVLLVRPPMSLEPAAVDSGFIRNFANTLRIDRLEAPAQ